MLAGTFTLLIVALIALMVSASRALRSRRQAPDEPSMVPYEQPVPPNALELPLDTNLDGLDLEVPAESPGAALLTPLRTGEWQPPEEPAPVAGLLRVSLDARVGSFEEQPALVPEAPASPHRPVELPAPIPIEPAVETEYAPAALPVSVTELALQESIVPDVGLGSVDVSPELPSPPEVKPGPDFGWAALIPHVEQVVVPEEDAAATETVPDAPSFVASDPPLAPFTVALNQPDPGTWMTSPALETVSAEPSLLPDDTFWESVFREQSQRAFATAEPEAAPVTVPDAAEPRVEEQPDPVTPISVPAPPAPVVDDQAEPSSQAAPTSAPLPPAFEEPTPSMPELASRPRAVVRSIAVPAEGTPVLEPLASVSRPTGRADAPELVMAAPVEMWFGESRIGVKAGTKTYAQFRKYADALFEDLRDSENRRG